MTLLKLKLFLNFLHYIVFRLDDIIFVLECIKTEFKLFHLKVRPNKGKYKEIGNYETNFMRNYVNDYLNTTSASPLPSLLVVCIILLSLIMSKS